MPPWFRGENVSIIFYMRMSICMCMMVMMVSLIVLLTIRFLVIFNILIFLVVSDVTTLLTLMLRCRNPDSRTSLHWTVLMGEGDAFSCAAGMTCCTLRPAATRESGLDGSSSWDPTSESMLAILNDAVLTY